ncbi:MAG: hypothetical protein KDE53_37645, partial [Caldilineaceae bacterium]|nr:hypothetical protein [Caldilineaceae bacterium]
CRNTVPSLEHVITIDIDELDATASKALAEHTAKIKGVPDCDGAAIYQHVGGNPLAIILVVSLMHYLPAESVLTGIRSGEITDLYNFIYHQSWQAISHSAKELLFTIERAGGSAKWSWLEWMNHDQRIPLQAAIRELTDFSLVYSQRKSDSERLYSIHRLTSTFLRTQILGWK